VAPGSNATPVTGNFVRFGDPLLDHGAYAYAIVPEGNAYYKVVIEGRAIGTGFGTKGKPVFATRLEAHVRVPQPPKVDVPGTLNVVAPNPVNASFALSTSNGYLTGHDGATTPQSSILGVAFDDRLSFGLGGASVAQSGGGQIIGSNPSPRVPGSTESVGLATQTSLETLTSQATSMPTQATYGALKSQGDITGGENVITASSVTLSNADQIGTPDNPVVTIIQPTSIPTAPLLDITGHGTYYGLVIVDLSQIPGPGPIVLPDALMNITGQGGMRGVVMVNLPDFPIVPKPSKPVISATGHAVLEGVAVVQVNGPIQQPLTLLKSSGGEVAQYNSANLAMALKPLAPAPKIVYVRETQ
jgi:hypothetical protein